MRLKWEPWLPIIRAMQLICAGSYKWTIAALETQVECTAEVVCLQKPPRKRGRGGVGISHSAYEIRKEITLQWAIQLRGGLAVNEQTDLSRGAIYDLIISDIRKRGEKISRIVNIYNQ
jgi:hypothetical protein